MPKPTRSSASKTTRARRTQASPRTAPSPRKKTIAPLAWRDLGKFAQALDKETPDKRQLEMGLAILGQYLKAGGLEIATPEGQVLAAWGRVPRSTRADLLNPDRWQGYHLRVQDHDLGCLWIRRGEWQGDPARERFVQAAVRLLASVVQAQLVLAQERDKRALAETLQHVSEVLTATLDLDTVLARILDELARLVPYDSALVMLIEDGHLHLHAQRGYKRLARHKPIEETVFIPEETAKVIDVLSGTQPVILSDIRNVRDWVWIPFSTNIRSWMGVPLRVHDRALGLFSIDKSEPNFFTARHAALAAAVAPHAAIAIENARLFQELRVAEGQLRQLSAHVIEAQEAERQRIGRELHDDAGQAIVAMRAELEILRRQLPADAPEAQAQLRKVDSILRATARDLRLLSHELRSHLLDELGLTSALQQQVRDVNERFGLRSDFYAEGTTRRYPRVVELAAFRIAQEALTNVARHAHATSVRVELVDSGGQLRLTVQDDGTGLNARKANRNTLGIVGMRERALAANGTFQIVSQPGKGTRIVAEFPLTTGADV